MSRKSKDLSNSDRTKTSPLAPLRLSNIASTVPNGKKNTIKDGRRRSSEEKNIKPTFAVAPVITTTPPRSIKINDSNSKSYQKHRNSSSNTKLSDIELKDLNSDSLDDSLNQLISNGETLIKSDSSSSDHLSKDDIRKAGQLASLLVDTRNVLKADCNVIDPEPNLKVNSNSSNENTVSKISRNTYVRAEKVKTMLGVKYLYIERIHEWDQINGHENEHPGVEGVYNPLQILRNRKLRAKYNEYPKPLLMKTLPLACNVFSRHNQQNHHHHHPHRKKDWRMPWAIELNELISDSRWRVNHWDELKDPKGNYWFNTMDGERREHEHLHSRRKKKHNFRRRIHDRLFDSSEDEKLEKFSGSKNGRRLEPNSSSDGELHNISLSRSKSPGKGIRSKVKKFYQGDSSSSSNVLNQFDDPTNDYEMPYNEDSMMTPTPQNKVKVNGSNYQIDEVDRVENAPQLLPPAIKIEPTTPEPNTKSESSSPHQTHQQTVQDVEIQPTHKERSNTNDSSPISSADAGELSNSPGKNNNELIDKHEQNLAQLFRYLIYFIESCSSRTQYLLSIYPNYLNLVQNKINDITTNSIYESLNSMSSINDETLPAYEELYSGFLDETQSILHMVNEQYSMKIDTLLSTSDRSISEINASLSLELRKTNERLDSLENALINNSNNLKKDILNDASNYKLLYLILENIIVILLKLVWVIVNIYKVFAFLVRIIWKIIRIFI
ncbi:uncharacterized protein KGF55_000539 [Candida pseudojiufengensis]|uniref:uncharacterized protein n=1 Tax=Candida pseudojiufengensis TaxID=497109 RepID=UPI0022245E2F|nr:uncharacterized protein KGF55_000539 [Candida pseudojiufengensis]KAI5966230.1 hypothetical protein KGF55_000539 [Candida pseudojiufengensis]